MAIRRACCRTIEECDYCGRGLVESRERSSRIAKLEAVAEAAEDFIAHAGAEISEARQRSHRMVHLSLPKIIALSDALQTCRDDDGGKKS